MIYQINAPDFNLEVLFNSETLAVEARQNGTAWKTLQEFQPYFVYLPVEERRPENARLHGNQTTPHFEGTKMAFLQAGGVTHTPFITGVGQGVRSRFEGFEHLGKPIPLAFDTVLWVEQSNGSLHFEFIPVVDDPGVMEVAYPAPFELPALDESCYTVLPYMQGCLIPNNWPQEILRYNDGMIFSRAAYMPWWGQIAGRVGNISIIDTPWDAGYRLNHPAGGPTLLHAEWHASLGQVRYPRKLQVRFMRDGDYNDLCKIYREVVRESGGLRTLAEKAVENPRIKQLIGSPVVHTGIFAETKPESVYFNRENPEANRSLATFDERARQLAELKRKGVDKAYLHLDGWGTAGYDHQHPDVLPPCEIAGGWDGMRRLAAACRELGYLFAIHDQYRDYYKDAATFDPEQAVMNGLGMIPEESVWLGGPQAFLCAQFAPYYVRRNYLGLAENGVNVEGAYLDVFAVVELDECFHPGHRMSRRECLERRAESLSFLRSRGILASSEESIDWAVPYLDLVHHGPYALTPNLDNGAAVGIAVPLFNLVYHDCLVLPWSLTVGGWGIPQGDSGLLHAYLNGGTGYLAVDAEEDDIERVKSLCSFQARVAYSEMLRHEFVDGNRRHQRATFSGGLVVEVDFDSGTYHIEEPGA